MSYNIVKSVYFSSDWIEFYPYSQQFRLSKQVESSFSPSTNWEKVFSLGDKINRELKLSEKEIADEVNTYRKSKKKSSR